MTTYITLVNQLLRRINETELAVTGEGFADVRNLQALSKDAINSSIREIQVYILFLQIFLKLIGIHFTLKEMKH